MNSWDSLITANDAAVINPTTGFLNPQENIESFGKTPNLNVFLNRFVENAGDSTNIRDPLVRELKIRVPTNLDKKYNVMRFSSNLCVDLPQYNFVRMKRDDNSDDKREKPWVLKIGTKNGKTFKGRKEGALSQNKNYFVFTQAADGYIDLYPLQEWHTFHPVLCYKTFSAEEAEEVYEKRDKILNYFPLMRDRKNDNNEEDESDAEEGQQPTKKLKLNEQETVASDDDEKNNGHLAGKKKRSNDELNYFKEVHDEEDDEENNINYYDD